MMVETARRLDDGRIGRPPIRHSRDADPFDC
jgi:hypothetical protein